MRLPMHPAAVFSFSLAGSALLLALSAVSCGKTDVLPCVGSECTGSGTGSGTGSATSTATGTAVTNADCALLSACCAQVTDPASKAECTQVVALGVATTCAQAESDFEGDSLCGGPSSGTGSATATATPVPPDTACSALADCCGSLMTSAAASACNGIVAAGNANACGAQLEQFEATDACGGSTSGTGSASGSGTGGGLSGCSGLDECCGALPAAEQAGCNSIVDSGDISECTAEVQAYESAGYCGAPSSGSGSGTAVGSGSASGNPGGCAGLADCCVELPAADYAACKEIVMAGNDATCAAELTAYESDGFCE
jgi:hypothetical protein